LVFDNSKPTIDNVTVYNAVDNSTDNVTDDNSTIMIYLSAADNIAVSYYLVQQDNSSEPSTTDTNWNSLASSGTSFADNITGLTFDNASKDNNTAVAIYVWVMDNASNVSSAGSDNITYYYTP
jgi:hypothetical protein